MRYRSLQDLDAADDGQLFHLALSGIDDTDYGKGESDDAAERAHYPENTAEIMLKPILTIRSTSP